MHLLSATRICATAQALTAPLTETCRFRSGENRRVFFVVGEALADRAFEGGSVPKRQRHF
jgi:hypothetical protein